MVQDIKYRSSEDQFHFRWAPLGASLFFCCFSLPGPLLAIAAVTRIGRSIPYAKRGSHPAVGPRRVSPGLGAPQTKVYPIYSRHATPEKKNPHRWYLPAANFARMEGRAGGEPAATHP